MKPRPFEDETYVHLIVETSCPTAVPLSEIKRTSRADGELKMVRDGLYNGKWNQEVNNYKTFDTELCFQDDVLLRGNRIVIPSALRSRVLSAAHEGHPGIVSMKARLRTKVWWPRIDKDAENFVKAFRSCTLVSAPNPPNPMKRRALPTQAWVDVAIDFLGPLPSGHYLFVIVDYFSRYKEIKVMKTITADQTVEALKEIFSRTGIPVSITADNGRQLTSDSFVKLCSEYGITLHHTIPYWPQQNGEVERQNRDIIKRLKISQIQKSNWKNDLLDYLTMYNSTPHSTTGKSPSELFYKRQFRDKLEVRDNDLEKKMKGKEYADRKRKAKESDINVGQKVYVKNMFRDNKLTATFGGTPHTVISKNENDVNVENDETGQRYRRNIVHLKKVEDQWTISKNVEAD